MITEREAFNETKKANTVNSALYKTLKFIKDDWNLNYDEMAELTHVPSSTLQRWMKDETDLNNKKTDKELLVHFISIHKSLNQIFTSKNNLAQWLNTTHPALLKPPFTLMKESIEGLIIVRRYLDFQRGKGA